MKDTSSGLFPPNIIKNDKLIDKIIINEYKNYNMDIKLLTNI